MTPTDSLTSATSSLVDGVFDSSANQKKRTSTASIDTTSTMSGESFEKSSESEEEEELENLRRRSSQKEVGEPNKRISPFELRFSQMRAKQEFRDGRLVDDAVKQIEAVPLKESGCGGRKQWLLKAPFPPIEVLQWRCKLRDESGRPMVDEGTGGEIWDSQDRVFTLDNRRLYCYQRAAVELWPDEVFVDVVELPPQSLSRMRQVRKFRTLDCGQSVHVGGRGDGESLVHWSWRKTVGAEEVVKAADATSGCVQQRRRPRGEPRNARPRRSSAPAGHPAGIGPHAPSAADSDGTEGGVSDNWSLANFVRFLAVYALLRLVKDVARPLLFVSDAPEGLNSAPLRAKLLVGENHGIEEVGLPSQWSFTNATRASEDLEVNDALANTTSDAPNFASPSIDEHKDSLDDCLPSAFGAASTTSCSARDASVLSPSASM